MLKKGVSVFNAVHPSAFKLVLFFVLTVYSRTDDRGLIKLSLVYTDFHFAKF